MNRFIITGLLFLVFYSCSEKENKLPQAGTWHATLEALDGNILPFNFELEHIEDQLRMTVYNAEEEVQIQDIELTGDSIVIRMPVYEGYIKGVFESRKMRGEYIKESLDRVVPFNAEFGNTARFESHANPESDVTGVWESDYSIGTDDFYKAKGIFSQNGNKLTGTFRTNTGDYRYLEGVVDGDSLKLSTFDGAHAFLFLARITDSTMNGMFYSGNHFKEPFVAKRNKDFELADSEQLTFLKEGYDRIDFSFPDSSGKMVSLSDPEYSDKVVIVQIMGTWCPNCMDETRFLVNYLNENNHADLKIIALAFEYARTEAAAIKGIKRLESRVGVSYPVLLAQYGTSSKARANEKLPMLNHVLSYPTTIFIDKKGKVRKIHTGFNGPATGLKYTEFQAEFDRFVGELLAE